MTKNIEIGKIYECELTFLEGMVEVEIMKVLNNTDCLVRLIRCTKAQRVQLGDYYSSRFILPRYKIIGISVNFTVEENDRRTIMSELTKIEYQMLIKFYEVNKPVTKHELVEKFPDLNRNTAASVITSLLTKRYLEIAEIDIFRTSLARSYKPSLSFLSFLRAEYGIKNVEHIIQQIIGSIRNVEILESILILIEERKSSLILYNKRF